MTLVAWVKYFECLSQCLEKPDSCINCHLPIYGLEFLFTAIALGGQYASLSFSFEVYHHLRGLKDEAILHSASPTYAPAIPCIFGNAVLEYKPEERRHYETGVKAGWGKPMVYSIELKYLELLYQKLQAGLALTNDGYVNTGEGVDTPLPRTAPVIFRLLPALLL